MDTVGSTIAFIIALIIVVFFAWLAAGARVYADTKDDIFELLEGEKIIYKNKYNYKRFNKLYNEYFKQYDIKIILEEK